MTGGLSDGPGMLAAGGGLVVLGLVALASALLSSLILVLLVVTGGPWVWAGTAIIGAWLGRRAWRWLQRPVGTGSPR
jgi:hypothetical protein